MSYIFVCMSSGLGFSGVFSSVNFINPCFSSGVGNLYFCTGKINSLKKCTPYFNSSHQSMFSFFISG